MSGFATFRAPHRVTGTAQDVALGRAMVEAWQRDGIFQIEADAEQEARTRAALAASRRFFALPARAKAACVNDHSYSGYVASGEEVTAGERDASEIFTLTPDLPAGDDRPCHGPVPWPDADYRAAMEAHLAGVGGLGDRLLPLVALGLGLETSGVGRLASLTRGGWHHMRVLRFPAASRTTERGIGAHTDYGLLVIAAQDEVGGLYVRPPVPGERRPRNWLPGESTAGFAEDAPGWRYVTPVPGVLTVFPGDILQFLTGGALLSTPHRVRLADRERYALAYFHEPRFDARMRPLSPASPAGSDEDTVIHYGEHFTRMFMRCYPQRATTRRIEERGLLRQLAAAR
ncbi:2-oxoglutarate and iron-dependent oxygenase domain-containing protein [Streptomyces sp. NBC_00091]|uniref:2-oxoglutarate and iron-dependent oxygenase domain-containing protein n=1 Tax=Streptomyces sp. NBC_00091 TaxID=2975648 RepID=UPI00224F8CDD|nr:2-oxoglutarate and iron-dependent oxygenase domain-containing protein [Streptomyces sp. NBC_00091]MCX5380014.1 MFS transporter [Streptomyces sp. NBC_00091]